MRYSELIQLYFERSTALQGYWTLYVVVIGALLAFSSLRKERDLLTTVLVTVLFSVFAYKNLGAIQEATLQRSATRRAIAQVSQSDPAPAEVGRVVQDLLEPTLPPPADTGAGRFHVTCDLLTIATIWAMERRRSRKNLPGI